MKIRYEITRTAPKVAEFVGEGDTPEECLEDALQQAHDFDYSPLTSGTSEYDEVELWEEE